MKRILAWCKRTLIFWVEFTLVFTILGLIGAGLFYRANQVERSPAQIQALAEEQKRTSDGTAYWEWGSGGPNLVLLHGLLDSKDTFLALRELLGPRFRIFAYDLRGQGFTPARGALGIGGQVEQLKAFIDELQLGPVLLLGHSLGGAVAQAFAARYPQKVIRLILMDTYDPLAAGNLGHWESTNLRDLTFALLRSPHTPLLLPRLSGRWLARKLLTHMVHSPADLKEATIQRVATPMKLPGYWERLEELVAPLPADLAGLLKKESLVHAPPVTVLWGINDAWFFASSGQRLCERYPKCRFHFIPDAGHLPHEEQPDKVAALLLSLDS